MSETLVVDASVAVAARHTPMGFARLRKYRLIAPHLMITEASSVMHEMAWRGDITKPRAKTLLTRLLDAPVEINTPDELARAAWDVADQFGWAKTYDAQYVALAQLMKCRLLTIDERMLRGVARLGIAVRPHEV